MEFFPTEASGEAGLAGGPTAWQPAPVYGGGGKPTTRRADALEVESARRSQPARWRGPANPEEPPRSLPWTLTRDEITAISNPIERLTLKFVHDVLGEDRRRVQRRISAPMLFNRMRTVSSHGAMVSHLDERDREDQILLLAREGNRMLDKPMRTALRDTTFIRDLELVLDDFKAANLPFSSYPEEARNDTLEWGRISLHLRTSRPEDPVEMTYVRRGWRIGSGRERLKLSYTTHITEHVMLSFRTHYFYDENMFDLWGDLHWRVDRGTRVHLLAGDRVDLLTGATLYPLVHSPVVLQAADESPGFLFYVEHLF